MAGSVVDFLLHWMWVVGLGVLQSGSRAIGTDLLGTYHVIHDRRGRVFRSGRCRRSRTPSTQPRRLAVVFELWWRGRLARVFVGSAVSLRTYLWHGLPARVSGSGRK